MKHLIILLITIFSLFARDFRIASYNVENLFDLKKSGNEYVEYIPNQEYGWDKNAFKIKVKNIAQVICDLKPDIIGLQEIESLIALKVLQKAVNGCGWSMPYEAIANKKSTTVKTALLSKFPIIKKREIDPDGTFKTRNILEVVVKIDGKKLRIFVNHWKSRNSGESRRLVSAKALAKRLMQLPKEDDYVLLGDFNSNWNEYKIISKSLQLNDTNRLTGINHILKTLYKDRLVNKYEIKWPYHYDLWLELPPQKRWSHNFFGKKSSLDHIILPFGMFNDKGVNYKDQTFYVFKPSYLFKDDGSIFRWQIDKRVYKRHLNRGYSDHLPIYAEFTTKPFEFQIKNNNSKNLEIPIDLQPKIAHISELYDMPLGWTNIIIPEVVVIYKKDDIAIIKEPSNRAILVYKDVDGLKLSHKYKINVKKIDEYRGIKEITKLEELKDFGKVEIASHFLKDFKDLSDRKYLNEVVFEISGIYKRGYLYYEDNKKIKIYFKNRKLRPKNKMRVTLKYVRIGLYKNRPELIVE